MKLATEKQISFIRTLATERDVTMPDTKALSRADASRFINSLLAMPKAPVAADATLVKAVEGLNLSHVPSGRYAASDDNGVTRFFKIDNVEDGKWAKWVFVKIMASATEYRQGAQKPNQVYNGKSLHALTEIATDPKAASIRYGQELGVCGVCGRTLTDPASISKGIGPICEGRF